jgi:hypothetical protein
VSAENVKNTFGAGFLHLQKGVSHFQKAPPTYKRCSPLLQKAYYPPLYKEASFQLKRQNWLQPQQISLQTNRIIPLYSQTASFYSLLCIQNLYQFQNCNSYLLQIIPCFVAIQISRFISLNF